MLHILIFGLTKYYSFRNIKMSAAWVRREFSKDRTESFKVNFCIFPKAKEKVGN